MDKNYNSAMDKIHASEAFKAQTAALMKEASAKQQRKHIGWIPAVAAALAIAVMLSVILIPHTVQHGFTLTASAAGNAALTEESYVEAGELSWGGGAYTVDHYAEEFLTDISVAGENIDSITYSVTNGMIGLPDSCTRLTDHTGKTAMVNDGDGFYSSEGYSYYDTVTCSYDDPFTEDDKMMIASADLSAARENGVFIRYYDAMDQLAQAHRQPLTLSKDEIESIFTEYYNKVLQEMKLNITVTYTDGKTESKAIGFTADCEAQPGHRSFYAYVKDENGDPHPVRFLDEADVSFLMSSDIDWEHTDDYLKVKDIFTEDDLIEFDSYDTTIILSARLEK